MKRISMFLVLAAAALALAATTVGTAAASRAKAASASITIIVKSDDQHAKKGPDGKWHDAFLPANPVLKAGQKTTITIVNYDEGAHSLIAPGLNLNVQVPAAKGSKLGRVTFSLTVKKAGRYDWWCGAPCDPWAMTHNGFMRGSIVAKA